MPRKELRPRERRKAIPPHYRYGSVLVSRFIGKINFRGKKNLSERIISQAFAVVKERTKEDPVAIFTRAIENAKPLLEVKPRRVGGATYQVPVAVRSERGTTLAMRWILNVAREKEGRPMSERLAEEFIAASRKEGAVIKKRDDTHKMAEANKAFAHYRW
ncbi:MAG: 30S ribosomal protein S7 [Elusimicrobia bacterium]|nr:30S ribosomal protein S7 [Elusimicrobiota bacterium]